MQGDSCDSWCQGCNTSSDRSAVGFLSFGGVRAGDAARDRHQGGRRVTLKRARDPGRRYRQNRETFVYYLLSPLHGGPLARSSQSLDLPILPLAGSDGFRYLHRAPCFRSIQAAKSCDRSVVVHTSTYLLVCHPSDPPPRARLLEI